VSFFLKKISSANPLSQGIEYGFTGRTMLLSPLTNSTRDPFAPIWEHLARSSSCRSRTPHCS
jgi:hypothetical protein